VGLARAGGYDGGMERYAIDAAMRYVESAAPKGRFVFSPQAAWPHSSGDTVVMIYWRPIDQPDADDQKQPILFIVDPVGLHVRLMSLLPEEFGVADRAAEDS
jgi:hypothetical protein